MKKKYLFLSMLVTILLGMMISCEALEPDDSNNDSETPTFYNTYDESGLYLGIIGFNDVTIEKGIDLLNSSTIDECKSFIDDFTTEKATLLYYAEEEALNNLKHSKFPEDLTSVSIVTFTDGLDQGSINLRKEDFPTSADFLGALENRIKSDMVIGVANNPQSINAYTIGLRGNDIRNEVEQQRFRDNLEKLSSSEENMYEASNMEDVNKKFKEIAKSLYNSFNVHSIEFKISSNWEEGLTFRFTFDELINNSAESSTCYLECTIQGDGVSNIKTEGCKYNGEPFVKANSLGVYNYIKFINITDTEGKALDVSKVQQYTANPDNTWQITSEFSNEKDVKPEVEQKTAVVMLVLDCSSSLGDDFPKMQEAAKDFISLLLNASEQKSTITFNANGGNGYMSELIYEKDETKSLFYNTFEREGYVFVGWNTKADGSGDNYSDGQNIQPTEDLTLYAQWEKIQYFTISFDANGGTGSMQSIKVVKGSKATLLDNEFTRTDFNFKGWNTKADGSGASYSNKQSFALNSDIILYAQWKKVEYATITFNANGGSGSMQSISVVKGSSTTLPNVTFTRSGYNFKGWNTKADGSGFAYQNRQSIASHNNLTLYAQWEKTVEYITISFIANGGSGTMQPLSVEKGTTVALSNVTFTRSGYTFKSWNTSSDGSGFTYINKQTLTPNVSLTLYAQWEKTTGTANGHEWVDLGLPSGTKWATTNVGASTPEGYGNYYAWGETSTKSSYTWSNYKWCRGTYNTLTKYGYLYNFVGTIVDYGVIDNKKVLELSDDAARANWGGSWRMPTVEQLEELGNGSYCLWTKTTLNGVDGYVITSKVNGNSIFLPAAGSKGDDLAGLTSDNCYYWSCNIANNYPSRAYVYSGHRIYTPERFMGASIRPVLP